MSLYKCKMYVSQVETFLESLSFHDFRFSMSLSLSPNLLYRQTTDCTEGGGLTREHCIFIYKKCQKSYANKGEHPFNNKCFLYLNNHHLW